MTLVQTSLVDLACPPWCVSTHHAHELTADQDHQSQIRTLPAVLRHKQVTADGALHHHSVAGEIDVVRHRDLAGGQEWVFIGDDDHELDLSLESAQRLYDILGQVLASPSA